MDWEETEEHRMEWEEAGGAATPAAIQEADPEQGPMWGCCRINITVTVLQQR